MIRIADLWFTQRKLQRFDQIESLVEELKDGGFYKVPISLQLCDDDEIEIIDGHHRVVALVMAGFDYLRPEDYSLANTEFRKNRFWRVGDLETHIVC